MGGLFDGDQLDPGLALQQWNQDVADFAANGRAQHDRRAQSLDAARNQYP